MLTNCRHAVLLAAAMSLSASAAGAVPDFSGSAGIGWISFGPEYIPVPGKPRPVSADPAHPFVPNAVEILSGQPDAKASDKTTFPVSDVTNPILQPWVRAQLTKLNKQVLSGHPFYSEHSSCWPMGVPTFLLYPVAPVYFIQSPGEVTIVWQGDHMVRHVYLNVPHSSNVRPSFYGDSIGHYEGDALVVDTIGLTTRTYVDEFRTPHTDKLHVIERFHMINAGKTMQVDVNVEDPGAFTTPWDAIQRYRRVDRGPLEEQTCSESNVNYFNEPYEPIPQATRHDF
jgi:hypothetical protein